MSLEVFAKRKSDGQAVMYYDTSRGVYVWCETPGARKKYEISQRKKENISARQKKTC